MNFQFGPKLKNSEVDVAKIADGELRIFSNKG